MNEFGSGHAAAAAAVTNASRTPNVEKLEEKYKAGETDFPDTPLFLLDSRSVCGKHWRHKVSKLLVLYCTPL